MLKKYRKHLLPLAAVMFVFGLLAFISYKTPLQGDDWGYYLNSLNMSPIEGALNFYNSWSGRFFSELWGFIIPKNKWLWNIINPLLFTGIFAAILKLANLKKNNIVGILTALAVMLSIDDNLRMETYTWIMGTTYIVPLFFTMVYFIVAEKLLNEENISKKTKVLSYLSNALLIVIGLMMENIAATMIGGIAILVIYAFIKKKEAIRYLVINLIFSSGAFIVMRMSPGSTYRTMRDAAEWMELSVFEKLAGQYPNFLELTFIRNNYMILVLSLAICLLVIFGLKKTNKIFKAAILMINVVAAFSVFSFVVIKESSIFTSGNSLFSKLFWPLYIVMAFVVILIGIEDEKKKLKTAYTLVIAGASSLVMLYSPTFGSRSVIYTVYYIILVILLIMDEINLNKWMMVCLVIMMLAIIGDRTNEYIYKYKLVGYAQEERLEIVKYYQDHPEVEEAWIPRFPVYTVHGADVEIGDDYHFEVFKEYYNLPQDADKIYFYYKEN